MLEFKNIDGNIITCFYKNIDIFFKDVHKNKTNNYVIIKGVKYLITEDTYVELLDKYYDCCWVESE